MPLPTSTRLPIPAHTRRSERFRRRLRRNAAAAALRSPEARFRLRRMPSGRLYRRHSRHRDGTFAAANFGWV